MATSFGTKVKKLLIIPNKEGKWQLELNIMDWGRGEVYDLRRWEGERMSKGLTLSKEEVLALIKEMKEEDL